MKIIFRTFATLSIVFAVTISPNVNALITDQQVENASKQMSSIIHNGHKKCMIPGCVFVVVRHNKIVCTIPFGYTDADSKTPITTDTLFPISSGSKNVTALLCGALVDSKKLDWADKVRKYDKEFFVHSEEYSKELTIRDLISHCSGFKHFAGDSLWNSGYSKKQMVDAFKYFKQIPGDFRQYYGYQNVFFGLIGSVLEKATGEKYEDLVQKYLFNKMNMKHASAISLRYETSRWGHIRYLNSRFSYDVKRLGFWSALTNYIKEVFVFKPKKGVTGHTYFKDGIVKLPEIGFFHIYPATSGISLSATEFAKWMQMLLSEGKYGNNTVVTQKTFKTITTPVVNMKKIKSTDDTFTIDRFPRENLHYGIGTFIAKYADNGKNPRSILFHMGGTYGAESYFVICPEEDIGVGVLINLGGTAHTLFAEYMCNYFMDLCFDYSVKDWVQVELDRQQKDKQFINKDMSALSEYSTPMVSQHKYEGTFTSEIYGDVTFSSKDGKLVLSNGIKSAVLTHVNGNIFSFSRRDMQVWFNNMDALVAFYPDTNGDLNQCRITCFGEENTIFERRKK